MLAGMAKMELLNPLLGGIDMTTSIRRRRLLALGGTLAGVGLIQPSILSAADITRTTDQVVGPFYPVVEPLDKDANLTAIEGKSGQAEGELIHLMGRVLDIEGKPVVNATVKIWQANAKGRYAHYADTNEAPLDPNFEGFGVQSTDAQGRYSFQTIKPGAYAVGPITRTPHIHFEVIGPRDRLITQMYFAGEPLNENDVLLNTSPNPESMIATMREPTPDLASDSRIAQWDIVLGWDGNI